MAKKKEVEEELDEDEDEEEEEVVVEEEEKEPEPPVTTRSFSAGEVKESLEQQKARIDAQLDRLDQEQKKAKLMNDLPSKLDMLDKVEEAVRINQKYLKVHHEEIQNLKLQLQQKK